MKATKHLIALTALLALSSQSAFAQGSARHFSQAVDHSVKAVGHSVVAGTKLSAGVIAVPLTVSATAGQASNQAAAELWDYAEMPIGTPLPITDETVTAGPSPDQAINR